LSRATVGRVGNGEVSEGSLKHQKLLECIHTHTNTNTHTHIYPYIHTRGGAK
jgi:hypothetical protein